MSRYFHHMRIAAIAGVVVPAAFAFCASPAAAIECPPGVHNAVYCTNDPPTATTTAATGVGTTTATLNGVINSFGVNVRYYFQYGKTRAYGKTTPTQTLIGCPPGVSNPQYCVCPPGTTDPAYCATPGTGTVSAVIDGLKPNTKYHFRLIALNGNGTARGNDETFTTHKLSPISSVHAPASVRHGRDFRVIVILNTRSTLTISLLFKDTVVTEFFTTAGPGRVSQRFTAPRKAGNYVIRVVAKSGGVTEKVSQGITIT
jgi:hypothetical protein